MFTLIIQRKGQLAHALLKKLIWKPKNKEPRSYNLEFHSLSHPKLQNHKNIQHKC